MEKSFRPIKPDKTQAGRSEERMCLRVQTTAAKQPAQANRYLKRDSFDLLLKVASNAPHPAACDKLQREK